jgi:hypothetical protein
MPSVRQGFWIGALACLFAAGTVRADVPMALDRFNLSVGGFYPTVDARLSANGSGIAGSDVDFARDLALDNHRTLPNLRLQFLVFDNQGFSFSGYRYSRSAGTTLDRDIVFGGNEYDTNAFVQARLRLDTYDAAWHWWFSPTAQDVLGLGLGAAYYDVKGTIDGTISVNGSSASAHGEADGNAIAPLLTLGWRHAFSENVRGYAEFSGVRKPSGTLTGHLLNGMLGLEYYPWQNLGLALEYSANNLDLKADKASWVGRARIHFHGPAAFVRLRF